MNPQESNKRTVEAFERLAEAAERIADALDRLLDESPGLEVRITNDHGDAIPVDTGEA